MPENTTNPEPVDSPVPLPLDTIKENLRGRLEIASANLIRARKERDKLNARIRDLVAEETEAQRILRALEPSKRKKNTTGKATS